MKFLQPDLSKPTCRVCLENKTSEELFSIFDMDVELSDLQIYEKIEHCAGIKLISDSKLPAFICCRCNEYLQISYKFRVTCHESEEYLKLILEAKINQPTDEQLLKPNDFTKVESTIDENSFCVFKRSDSISPLPESIKKDEDVIPCSPAHYEEPFHEYLSDNESDVWIDINYPESEESLSCSENIEISVENSNLKISEEIDETCKDKKPLQSKKRSYVRKNKPKSTLEVSSDGPAIIKARKPRSKKRDTQPHVCEICGNVYTRRHILEHHIKRHSDQKEFECEICGNGFHSSFELRRHMRRHTGSRPYKCSYCPKAFGDHSTLSKHERVHRNERPFKCEICGSTFSYPGVLKRHKLVHTGEKPYKCEICGKCFNDRYHLQSHLRTIQHKNDPRVETLIQKIRENKV